MDTITDVEYSLEERKEGNVDSGCCKKMQQPLMEVEMEKLKPCPVCGNHQLKFVTSVVTSRTCVLCEECGEESNWCNTKNEAIEAWNRRVENAVN